MHASRSGWRSCCAFHDSGRFRLEGVSGPVRLRAVRSDYALRELRLQVTGAVMLNSAAPTRVSQGQEILVQAPPVKRRYTLCRVSRGRCAFADTGKEPR